MIIYRLVISSIIVYFTSFAGYLDELNKELATKKYDLDVAVSMVDTIDQINSEYKHKKFDAKYKNIQEALILGLFRHENWVEKILAPHKNSFDTPTSQLLKKYKIKKNKALQKFAVKHKVENVSPLVGFLNEIDQAVSIAARIEDQDSQNGYITFYHGRHWGWNYINDIWNLICALEHDQSLCLDKIFLRQRDASIDDQNLYDIRKKITAEGIKGSYLYSCSGEVENSNPERSEITFLNNTPISNLDRSGECSLAFFLRNSAVMGSMQTYPLLKKLLKKYHLQDYQEYFDFLYCLHHEANPSRGEFLAISIGQDFINKIVYPAKAGGYKQTSEATLKVLESCNKKIRDLDNNYFQEYQQEKLVFCAVALGIPSEQENSYKIQSIHLADRKKYELYKKELYKLFLKIKRDKIYNVHRSLEMVSFLL